MANEIFHSLRFNKDIILVSAGAPVPTHAPFIFERHEDVPNVGTGGWLDELNSVILKHGVDFVFPAHDDAILALVERRNEVRAEIIAPDAQTCRVARSKAATYQLLEGAIATPALLTSEEAGKHLPVFAKPDVGQGSQGALMIASREELVAIARKPGYLLCEFLPGREFTVDCFTDVKGTLLLARGRQRVRTKAGISVASQASNEHDFVNIAKSISSRMSLRGPWFFQVKENATGSPVLLEVGPRVAGAMALSRANGANLPLMALYDRAGYRVLPPRVMRDVKLDRALVNRYSHGIRYDTVYLDLDDTLVVKGQINTQIIAFLAQCLNRGVRTVVLTRCSTDPREVLDRHRISLLVDDVIWVRDGRPKSAFIRKRSAILIDDSFNEREEVSLNCAIPVFEPANLEVLLDDRE